MNWLRYVLLAVCILSALAGYRKGLVRTVLSMVSLILVTGLAIWMNPYVTDVLNERTTLPQYVEKKCLEIRWLKVLSFLLSAYSLSKVPSMS